MDFETLVRERRSIRGYKPDPVPKDVIQEIIEIAKGAPSSMNTQPWFFHVITGEPLERIRQGNTERMLAGAEAQREIPVHGSYEGIHRQRQIEVAVQLFEAMGIARDDKERRQDWVMRGFRQFDAPVSIVMTYDKSLEPATISHFDLGAVTYGLVLAAWTRGLGTVINGQGIMQSAVVREHAKIPEWQTIMTCIAMGYPNDEFSANAVKSKRTPNDDIVTFTGFDGD
ncbi:MAG: nitroreductase [Alphaproteobacteria bacterium]|nr:nitroreductase [Alphaproteobacteria bacterium]MBL6952143.1 nitroreductase [Alphaproteobacteria bacterium]